jgi:hypothetical protein
MAEQSLAAPTTSRGGGSVVKVQSRSNPGTVHYVDLRTQSCSCKGFAFKGECRHLRLLNAPEFTITRVEYHDGYRRTSRYEIHDSEGGYEGCVPSFADAYETIVYDLGGVLGAPGVGGYYGERVA